MSRRALVALCFALFAALVPAAQAGGGGPSPGVSLGWDGVVSPNGKLRYVAVPGGTDTTLAAIQTSDGRVAGWTFVAGQFGIPMIAQDGSTGGLSRDGKILVLGDATGGAPLRTVSHFVVLNPKQLGLPPHEILLTGDYTYDALSPNGKRLYLIQHVSATNLTRYVVRAYDLERDSLLPGKIADRTQRGWTMQGYPMTRATSVDGRWVYTLYQNTGGYPFVHALDTVRGVAHCIGVPFTGDQNALSNMRLALGNGERTLALHWKSGRPYLGIDTATWRISRPRTGLPWWMLGVGACALLLAATLLLRYRRHRAHEPVDQLREVVA
jgi:hypothetical protein